MKKRERLELIKKIVLENEIETQKELVKLLKNEGLQATQRQFPVILMRSVSLKYQLQMVAIFMAFLRK